MSFIKNHWFILIKQFRFHLYCLYSNIVILLLWLRKSIKSEWIWNEILLNSNYLFFSELNFSHQTFLNSWFGKIFLGAEEQKRKDFRGCIPRVLKYYVRVPIGYHANDTYIIYRYRIWFDMSKRPYRNSNLFDTFALVLRTC